MKKQLAAIDGNVMFNNSLPPNGSNRFQPRQPSNSSGNNNGETPFTKILRSIMIWGALFAAVIIVYVLVNGGKTQTFPISYTKYVDFLNENAIQSAKIYKSQLNDFEFHGTLKEEKTIMIDGRAIAVKHFTTKLGVLDSKTEELWATKGISWTYEESDSTFWSFVMSFLPWVVLIGVYIFVMRKMSNGGAGGGSRGIFSFGKSRARLVNEHGANRKTFADVAGVEEAKEELREINIGGGFEYWYDQQFAFRTGYFYENYTKGNRQFITLGAGLKYQVLTIDMSYLISTTQQNPLANTLRFTMRFAVGAGGSNDEEPNE